MYIVSQIAVAIGMIIDLLSKVFKNKKWLLFYMTLASLFYTLSYVFLKSPLPAIANAIALARGIIYLFLDKNEKPYFYYIISALALSVAFSVATIFFWSGPMDIIMLVSVNSLLVIFAFKNTLIIRLGLIANCGMWCVYNFTLHGYVNMTCDILNIILVVVALIRFNILNKSQSNKNKELIK